MQWGSFLAKYFFFDFWKLPNYPIIQLSDKKVFRGKVVPLTFTKILVKSNYTIS